MGQPITYHWGENHLSVDLGNRIQSRVRVLFTIELIVAFGAATLFLLKPLPGNDLWLHAAIAFSAAALYALAAYRFLQRMFYRERVVVDATHLTIMQRSFFNQKIRSYDRRNMGPLHYVGRDQKTDHPLKGRHFDYFGFETHERLVQNLHQDGSLYFNYGGFPVRFGRGLFSWDAEELVRMLQLYCGNSLVLGAEWAQMMQENGG
jgi:hypothetical protein